MIPNALPGVQSASVTLLKEGIQDNTMISYAGTLRNRGLEESEIYDGRGNEIVGFVVGGREREGNRYHRAPTVQEGTHDDARR